MARLLNFVLFQAAWFLCVATVGRPWAGAALAGAGLLLVVHARWIAKDARREFLTLALVAPLGFLLDSAFGHWGVLRYHGAGLLPGFAPLWILVLWLWFAATFHGSLAWLQHRPLLGGLLGLAGAPCSYAAGARLGAVDFGDAPLRNASIVAVGWALATPTLLWIAARPGLARQSPKAA